MAILDLFKRSDLSYTRPAYTRAKAVTKMRRDELQGLDEASSIHYTVGKKSGKQLKKEPKKLMLDE